MGSSLGTSSILWNRAASLLGNDYDVVAWDLPGHGVSPAATETFDVSDLAEAVVDLVDSIAPGEAFHYAGVSLGGATGLQLGIKHGERLKSLSVQCSGAKLGTPEGWLERAETVRSQGTPVMIQGSAQRWFAPGFMDREPEVSSRLLHASGTPTGSVTRSAARPWPPLMSVPGWAASGSPPRSLPVRWTVWRRRRWPRKWRQASRPGAGPPQPSPWKAWRTWRRPRPPPTLPS
ncbi:alpha/beta fold hydrolase [Arthrobacter nitrophenolicus]|uniref:alpha/beta fold hydrolase n=1 Tax=Arthrobacter nitrophenolicus TaxID=683150 RepID=UPI0030B8217F